MFVCAASIGEIAIKLSINKLPLAKELDDDLLGVVTATGFTPLPVTLEHAYAIRHLPRHRRDPFDRFLIAQSQVERLTIVINDRMIGSYSVDVLW